MDITVYSRSKLQSGTDQLKDYLEDKYGHFRLFRYLHPCDMDIRLSFRGFPQIPHPLRADRVGHRWEIENGVLVSILSLEGVYTDGTAEGFVPSGRRTGDRLYLEGVPESKPSGGVTYGSTLYGRGISHVQVSFHYYMPNVPLTDAVCEREIPVGEGYSNLLSPIWFAEQNGEATYPLGVMGVGFDGLPVEYVSSGEFMDLPLIQKVVIS